VERCRGRLAGAAELYDCDCVWTAEQGAAIAVARLCDAAGEWDAACAAPLPRWLAGAAAAVHCSRGVRQGAADAAAKMFVHQRQLCRVNYL
jgi:hypothetical protein